MWAFSSLRQSASVRARLWARFLEISQKRLQVRLHAENRNNIGRVRPRFLPIVPGLSRAANVAVAIVQRQQLEHHECMRLRNSDGCRIVSAIWQFSAKFINAGLSDGDRPSRTSASVDAILNVNAKIFFTLKFFGSDG